MRRCPLKSSNWHMGDALRNLGFSNKLEMSAIALMLLGVLVGCGVSNESTGNSVQPDKACLATALMPVVTANTALGEHGAIQMDPDRANEYSNSAKQLAELWRIALMESPQKIAECGYLQLANATQAYFGKNQTALDCDVIVGTYIDQFGITAGETVDQAETCLSLLNESQPEYEEFLRLFQDASR